MELINKNKFNGLPNKKQIINFVNEVRKWLFLNYFEEIKIDLCLYLKRKEKLIKKLFLKYISNDLDKANEFLNKLPLIKEMLETDLEMTLNSDPAITSVEEVILTYPGIYAISFYRIAHEIYLLDIKIAARIILEYVHGKTGIDIHPGAVIGKYFFIDHGTGIVIGQTAIIGHHVKIYHGVTLGAKSLKKGVELKNIKRHPTIKDYVTIYSHASILGGDTIIEENVTLGCNVFVTSSIPKNSKVVINVTIN